MPKRRDGPVRHKGNSYFYFDEIIGFENERRRVRFSLGTKDPEKARWLWEQEYRKQWSEYYGIQPKQKPKPVMFVDICKSFVNFERDIKHVKDWDTQRNRLRKIYELWGDLRLDQIKRDHLIRLDAHLRSQERSGATINHYMTLLKSLFNFAIREKLYTGDNPINEIKPYTTDRKRREYTADEIKRILEAADTIEASADPRAQIPNKIKGVILLLLYTAMRLGEAINLKWENVKGDKITLYSTETKQKREKVIPITKGIQAVLDRFEAERINEYVVPLVLSEKGRKDVYTRDVINAIREKSGISDFDFHTLRHTAITILVSRTLGKGVGLKDIMLITGHSRMETILGYIHSDFNRMKKALKILEGQVKI